MPTRREAARRNAHNVHRRVWPSPLPAVLSKAGETIEFPADAARRRF